MVVKGKVEHFGLASSAEAQRSGSMVAGGIQGRTKPILSAIIRLDDWEAKNREKGGESDKRWRAATRGV
jgi:hypothetical protein